MIHIYLNIVLIRLLGDMFQRMKFKVSSLFTMNKLVEATLVLKRRLQKFYSVAFIGLLFFMMLMVFYSLCDRCQRMGSISKMNMMPFNLILVVEIFDV